MTDKKEKEISHLGEFGLIELLTKDIKLKNSTSIVGVGDDAAVLDYSDGRTIVTSDILMEGVHFDLIYTPLKHLGYKSVIVNLSDIYAMNATPQQIIVSLAISSKITVDMVEEIYEGIKLACEYYNIDLVGGDTTTSLTGLTINVTAIGIAKSETIAYRSGAKENDLICVSGDLGAAYLGLVLLEREKKVFTDSNGGQPDFSGYEYLLERQLKPEARHDIVEKLAENGIKPTAMIDISDGLSSEILHITEMSQVGCQIYADKIPVSSEVKTAAEDLELEPVTIGMNGGEDYELLFTISLKDYENIQKIEGISIIGHITDKADGNYLILPDNSALPIQALGWNPIKYDESNM